MSKEERYKIKKISKDCLFPNGLYELKDKETKFFLIIEDKRDVEKLKDYLISRDKQLAELKAELKAIKDKQDDEEITRHMMCGDYTWVEMVTKLTKENEQLKAENERILASKHTWEKRANIYADLIVSLNEILPNKQEQEINFQKVIEDVKQQLKEKDDEVAQNEKDIRDMNIYNDQLRNENDKLKAENSRLSVAIKLTTKQVCEKIRKLCKNSWEVKEYETWTGITLQGQFNQEKFLQGVSQIENNTSEDK